MNKEYAIYPFRYMNITQRHDQGSHIPNWKDSTNFIDLPWDEACQDGGRSYFEPQNDFLVEEVLGLGNSITNTVRLKSVNKLYIPYKNEPDYLYLTLSHMNEDNLRQVKQGDILMKGTKILLEGTDGIATGNHFHITANLGKYYGFLQNNNGAWCFTYQESLLPNQAFYLDKDYTNTLNNAGYSFTVVPNEISFIGTVVEKDETVNQLEIKSKEIYCRDVPSSSGEILGYVTPGIYNYTDVVKFDNISWYYIGIGWIQYSDNTITLYPKKEMPTEIVPDIKVNIVQRIINAIVNFFKRLFKIK